MAIGRDDFVEKLATKKNNGMIKVITGVRRCGKSYLLFTLYKKYLIESGVAENQIITVSLDNDNNATLRDPTVLAEYLQSQIKKRRYYYVFIDEIQFVGKKKISDNPEIFVSFYDVLNGLLQNKYLDIYVTGSNSKMLSKDVATEFRGRGDIMHIAPLSFSEYYNHVRGDKAIAFDNYLIYGGFPYVQHFKTDKEKREYLSALFAETYLKDINERYKIQFPKILMNLTSDLCSSQGSLTNASKIARTINSVTKQKINSETVADYLEHLTDSFVFSKVLRYDIKGKKYFSYPNKYYCVDTGLNNACLNFRQQDEPHLMECIIYNELVMRGHNVDIGVVESTERTNDGGRKQVSYEIDFVINANSPGEKCYIQSALSLPTAQKKEQEIRPFLKLNRDFNKKIIITKTSMPAWTDENGIEHIGIYDFLLGKSNF